MFRPLFSSPFSSSFPFPSPLVLRTRSHSHSKYKYIIPSSSPSSSPSPSFFSISPSSYSLSSPSPSSSPFAFLPSSPFHHSVSSLLASALALAFSLSHTNTKTKSLTTTARGEFNPRNHPNPPPPPHRNNNPQDEMWNVHRAIDTHHFPSSSNFTQISSLPFIFPSLYSFTSSSSPSPFPSPSSSPLFSSSFSPIPYGFSSFTSPPPSPMSPQRHFHRLAKHNNYFHQSKPFTLASSPFFSQSHSPSSHSLSSLYSSFPSLSLFPFPSPSPSPSPFPSRSFTFTTEVDKNVRARRLQVSPISLSEVPISVMNSPSAPHLISLSCESRNLIGSQESRWLRLTRNRLPGVYFERKKATRGQPISIELKDFRTLWKQWEESIYTRVFELYIDDAKEPLRCIIKQVSRHPATGDFLNVTFLEFTDDVRVKLTMPIWYLNSEESEGSLNGGEIIFVRHQIPIYFKGKSHEIPPIIAVDLMFCDIGRVIRLEDLILPKCLYHVKPKKSPVLCTILEAEDDEEDEGDEMGEGGGGTPAAGAAAIPTPSVTSTDDSSDEDEMLDDDEAAEQKQRMKDAASESEINDLVLPDVARILGVKMDFSPPKKSGKEAKSVQGKATAVATGKDTAAGAKKK